jgi:hypothetical protein
MAGAVATLRTCAASRELLQAPRRGGGGGQGTHLDGCPLRSPKCRRWAGGRARRLVASCRRVIRAAEGRRRWIRPPPTRPTSDTTAAPAAARRHAACWAPSATSTSPGASTARRLNLLEGEDELRPAAAITASGRVVPTRKAPATAGKGDGASGGGAGRWWRPPEPP